MRKFYQFNPVGETGDLQTGIRPFGNFIIGLPGDSEASMRAMGKYARKLGLWNAVFSTIVPDVGTAYRDKKIKEGMIEDHLIQFSNSYPAYPEQLNGHSPEELKKIRKSAMMDFYLHPAFIYRNLKGIRSTYELRRKFRQGWALLNRVRKF